MKKLEPCNDAFLFIKKPLQLKKEKTHADAWVLLHMVGKTGFEPATPWSQTRCATGLRHFPIPYCLYTLLKFTPVKNSSGEGGIRTRGTV